MANDPVAPIAADPVANAAPPELQAKPVRPPELQPGGAKDHRVWNEDNNGISMVDAYTAKKLADAGVPTDEMADVESMRHPRITHDGWVPQIKGWESKTAAYLSGFASWGSLGTSGLLNTGLAKLGAFHQLAKVTGGGEGYSDSGELAREQKWNDDHEPVAHTLGAGTAFLASMFGGGAAAGATGIAGAGALEGGVEAGGQAAAALTKAQVMKQVATVLAPGAAIGLGEETNREINYEQHMDPWQIAASGALTAGIGGIIHGSVELGAVPLIKAAKPKVGNFLTQLQKAYKTTEGKWTTEKVLKSAEEIAAGEAAMNKPYVSQIKNTVHGGGVNTKESEEIAREIVTLTQGGMSPEEAADQVTKGYYERGKQARGPVRVTKTRTGKTVNTEGESVNVKNVSTDDAGNVTTTNKNTGTKSSLTEVEKRAAKHRSDTLDLDGDFTNVGDKPPPLPPDSDVPFADAEHIKHPTEMSEKELINHINENGGFENPDVKDHVKEMHAREADKDTIKSGLGKASDHFGSTAIGNRLISHGIDADEPLTFHFDANETKEGKLRKLGEWYEKILSPGDNALHKEGQSLARQYHDTGDIDYHDQWAQINAHLMKEYPRKRLPNGNVQPSFRDLSNAYRRFNGYTDSTDMLKITGSVPGEHGPSVETGGKGPRPPHSEHEPVAVSQPWTTNEKRAFESQTADTRTKTETTTKYPKPPKFDRYKHVVKFKTNDTVHPHFSKPAAAVTFLGARALDHVLPGASSLIKSAVGMDYAIAALLQNRAAIGRVMLKYGTKTARLTGATLKLLTRHERDYLQDNARDKLNIPSRYHTGIAEIKPDDVDHTDAHYKAVTKAVTRINSNPAALNNYMQQTVGDAMPPTVLRDYLQKSLAAAQAMQTSLVKDPRPPAMQSTPYSPPHSVKLRVLRDYHALVNPLQALENPTPKRVQLIESVHPELMAQFRKAVIGTLSDGKAKLNSTQQRKLSIIMGAPITARNDPAYIKRLQQTSADAPDADQAAGAQVGKGQPSINGKPSAKIASQVPLMFDPNPNVNNIQG